jgi:hypothetical protein
VSSRRHVTRVVGVLTALALVFGLLAGTASARTHSRHQKATNHRALTRHQKVVIRRQLMRQIKKNPKVIRKASFIKKASLVDFVLPVSIRLRNASASDSNSVNPGVGSGQTEVCGSLPPGECPVSADANNNPNTANIDLGASLGQRSVVLSGTLPAEITFHDSFDGGALGNVDIKLLGCSASGIANGCGLKTNSIPLLWNSQVSDPASHWWGGGTSVAGCGDFTNANATTASAGTAPTYDNGHVGNTLKAYAVDIGSSPASPPAATPTVNQVLGSLALGGYPGPSTVTAVNGINGVPIFDSATGGQGLQLTVLGDFKTFSTAATAFKAALAAAAATPNATTFGALSTATTNLNTAAGALNGVFTLLNTDAGAAFTQTVNTGGGLVDQFPGIDSIDALKIGGKTGDNDVLGPSPTPFPSALTSPGGFTPTVKDTVLRTNALTLQVATAGTQVQQDNATPDGSGPQGSQNEVIGPSGGQANLFGTIPGKDYGVDVTVSLATKINSIERGVDIDNAPLVNNAPYTAGIFACHQAWTGYVQNYLPGIRLKGNLHISPAITNDGQLRIAKATLDTARPANVALAACLALNRTYASPFQGAPGAAATAAAYPGALATPDPINTGVNVPVVGVDPNTEATAPNVACNSTPSKAVQNLGVSSLTPSAMWPAGSASAATDGSQVSVSGTLTTHIEADVLVGQKGITAP